MEPDNLLLDEFVLSLARSARPRVCFLPTASGDSERYVAQFYRAIAGLDCRVSDLQLFAHLRALGEIKAALQSLATDPARRALVEVDQLLEHVFRSGRIGG